MELFIKHFNDLSPNELWEIFYSRCAVFVVEQTCPYQDIDRFDKMAYHLWLSDNGHLVAYCRVLPENTFFPEVSVGRVISLRRREGLATRIVKEGIKTAREKFGAEIITIEAQVYARELYEKVGFVQISDEFMEDGIPHIKMQWRK